MTLMRVRERYGYTKDEDFILQGTDDTLQNRDDTHTFALQTLQMCEQEYLKSRARLSDVRLMQHPQRKQNPVFTLLNSCFSIISPR